jgi:hypothetical protein
MLVPVLVLMLVLVLEKPNPFLINSKKQRSSLILE